MFRHKRILYLASSSILLFSSLLFVAHTQLAPTAHAVSTPKLTVKKGPQLKIIDQHTVNVAEAPKASAAALQQGTRLAAPLLPTNVRTLETKTPLSKRAAVAPHNAGESLLSSSMSGSNTITPAFPSTFNKFPALADTSGICGNSSCRIPSPSVAAAPAGLALEIVNDSLALYNNNGVLQSSWPKTAQAFFGVPNPVPTEPTACDPNGPFLYSGRAWFDAYDNRFGVAMLQLEGVGAAGPSCTYTLLMWVAVSATNNPGGSWLVFAIPLNFGSDATGVAGLSGFGFDADGIFFSANIQNNSTGVFEYAEIVGCGKREVYTGNSIVCNALFGFEASNGKTNIELDTLQPVESLSTDFSPHAEFFVSTFNFDGDLSGNNCISTACNGLVVWSWSDPANTSGSGNVFSGDAIPTIHSYVSPPWASTPVCPGGGGCQDTGAVEISSTPTYHAGHIFFAHETGVINASSQFVVGIQWFDLVPTLDTGWPTQLSGVTEYQEGLLNARNDDLSCVDPVIMPNQDNDLILGYDYMGDTQYPSINYTFHRVSDPLNSMTGGLGIVEVTGSASSFEGGWGEWSSMSYPAPYQDFIWMVGIYTPGTPDWSTELMKFRFNLNG